MKNSTDIFCLDAAYSTTRCVTTEKPVIERKPEDRFESFLFLPEGERRKVEGGLRTKGFFKKSLPDKPLITIVTVVFNGEEYLEKTMLSVINQTYDNVEYIIIDGGSTDGTLEIIKKYEDKVDYWISEKDEGIYDAMNKGIDLAIGTWVNFLNAGDIYENKNIIEYLNFNESNLLYGKVRNISNDIYNNTFTGYRVSKKDYYYKMPICHQAIFYKTELFKKIGKYDMRFKVSADHEWMLRYYTKENDKSLFQDIVIAKYLLDGFSVKNALIARKERYHISNIYYYNKINYIKYLTSLIKVYGFWFLNRINALQAYRKIKKIYDK